MRAPKVKLELTQLQLEDLIMCVYHSHREGLGYGMVTKREEALLAANRDKLRLKLGKTLARHIIANQPR